MPVMWRHCVCLVDIVCLSLGILCLSVIEKLICYVESMLNCVSVLWKLRVCPVEIVVCLGKTFVLWKISVCLVENACLVKIVCLSCGNCVSVLLKLCVFWKISCGYCLVEILCLSCGNCVSVQRHALNFNCTILSPFMNKVFWCFYICVGDVLGDGLGLSSTPNMLLNLCLT